MPLLNCNFVRPSIVKKSESSVTAAVLPLTVACSVAMSTRTVLALVTLDASFTCSPVSTLRRYHAALDAGLA